MFKEILDADVLIVGAGIAGLSLGYFLIKNNLENVVIIDRKDEIGYPIKDTGLVSDRIFSLLPLSRKIVLDTYKTAIFTIGKRSFEVTAKKGKMVLLDRPKVDLELYDKIKDKIDVYLCTNLKSVSKNRYIAYTNRFKIKYKIIVDATGPFGFVRELYGLPNNKRFVIGMEAYTNSIGHRIELFLDKSISKNYFGWIIEHKEGTKVGVMDYKLTLHRFKRFLTKLGVKNYYYFYADIIKGIPEKILAYKNLITVGEATGYLKQFSLGGIIFSILHSKLAASIIKLHLESRIPLETYNVVMRKIFYKYLTYANLIRLLLKRKEVFQIVRLFRINKIASYLDLDLYTPKNFLAKL